MLGPSDIDLDSLVERLVDPVWRAELYATIAAEQRSHLPVTNAFEQAARRSVATPAALQAAVETILADNEEFIASALVRHPDMPEAFLLELCDRGKCVDVLGHRRSPLVLLERVAEQHGYAEAILSVGLEYYTDPAVSVDRYAEFAHRYRDHSWLLRTMAEVDASNAEKQALYEGMLVDWEEPAAFHARHLARSSSHPAGELGEFIDRYPYQRLFVVLLDTEINDDDKRGLVAERAARQSDPVVEQALRNRQARDQASSAEFSARDAAELAETGDPKVLLSLAGNARTPESVLDVLSRQHGGNLSRRVRNAAQSTLATTRTTANET